MEDDFKWLIGLAVTFALSIITAFRSLSALTKSGDDVLHARINAMRDEYVRRVDLDGHIGQLRESMKELKQDNRDNAKEMNKRIDQVLSLLNKSDD